MTPSFLLTRTQVSTSTPKPNSMAVRINPDGSITVGMLEDIEEKKDEIVEEAPKKASSTKKPTKKSNKE